MFSFLEQNMKSFNQHFYGADEAYFALRSGAKGDNGISYTGRMNNSDMIGFDFNCSGGERMHMFEILKWMVMRISNAPGIYYYDGERSKFNSESIQKDIDREATIIFEANNKNKSLDWYKNMVAVSRLSIIHTKYKKTDKPYPNDYVADGEKTIEELNTEIKENIDWIENDIKRLDELWIKSLKDESVSI